MSESKDVIDLKKRLRSLVQKASLSLDSCVVCSTVKEHQFFEYLRGGVLALVRWFVIFPVVYLSYVVKGLFRAPWRFEKKLEGPGITIINHNNAIYDILIAQLAAPQWSFFLLDMNYKRMPFLFWLLKMVRGVPFPRSTPHLSEERAIALKETQKKILNRLSNQLVQGHWLNVFPEGRSEESPRLRGLKYGVARVALKAQEKAGWALPLKIYVLGLNYEMPSLVGSYCYAQWATHTIDVRLYKDAYLEDPIATEKILIEDIEALLADNVVQADQLNDIRQAHKLAVQRKEPHFSGLQKAMDDFKRGLARPRTYRGVKCSRTESLVYQIISYGLFGVLSVIAWPFRTFGKLAARNSSEEMAYTFLLWLATLLVGYFVAEVESRWIVTVAVVTFVSARAYLWAYRRGVIE